MAHRWLSILVIVSAVTGCDNVEWGGSEIELVEPPPPLYGARADTASELEGPGAIRLPEGPVLYMGVRDSTGTRLIPVGEIAADSLLPFPSEQEQPGYRSAFAREFLTAGSEFVLFAGGTRVGNFVARDVDTDESFCTPRPAATGVAELIPAAAGASKLLALPREAAMSYVHGEYGGGEVGAVERNASGRIMGEVIPQVDARWPTSLTQARKALDLFTLGRDGPPAIATTFTFRDELEIAPAEPSSYALFLMGVWQENEYQQAFVWYRLAGRDGKGIPVFFEQFDWDGDGEPEILLDVLGEEARWTAALARRGAEWQRVFEEPCGRTVPVVVDDAGNG